MSPEAVDIIRKLLDPNPDTRLGCRERGTLDIKEHAFFAKYINFQRLYHLKEDPPVSLLHMICNTMQCTAMNRPTNMHTKETHDTFLMLKIQRVRHVFQNYKDG